MKSTFLFLVTTTMMTCTALGQPSNDKKNVLPDWAFGGFELITPSAEPGLIRRKARSAT